MSKWLKVKYDEYVLTLLPTQLRTADIFNFIYIPVKRIELLLKGVQSLWKSYYYRITHNGQVFSLTKVLNETFIPDDFEITDVAQKAKFYLWDEKFTEKDAYFGTIYLSDESAYIRDTDFIVSASFLDKNRNVIETLIKRYIPAGRKFKLERK